MIFGWFRPRLDPRKLRVGMKVRDVIDGWESVVIGATPSTVVFYDEFTPPWKIRREIPIAGLRGRLKKAR